MITRIVVAAGLALSMSLGTPSAQAMNDEDEAFLQYFMTLGGQLSGNENAEEVIEIGRYFCDVLRSGGRQSDAYIPLYAKYQGANDRQTIGQATAAAVVIYCPHQLDSP